MRSVCVLAALVAASAIGPGASAQEQIGPWSIEAAPQTARLISGGGGIWGWLNVNNVETSIQEAFTGFSIIDDGFANGEVGTTLEMTFAKGSLRNVPGDDLVVFDSRFSVNEYELASAFDNFGARLALSSGSFIDTGIDRNYFYNGSGPSQASILGRPVDLSDLGVPEGTSVSTVRLIILNGEGDPLGIGSLVPAPGAAGVLAVGALAALRRRR